MALFSGLGNVFSGSSAGEGLRITQTGTGVALRVEDSANPDVTPFIVLGDGSVGINTDTPATQLDVAGAMRSFYKPAGTVERFAYLSPDGAVELYRDAGNPYVDFRSTDATDYDARIQLSGSTILTFQAGGYGTMATSFAATQSGIKIGGTANRATTEGTNQLVIFNGTAPVGTLANGVTFYSASGEARVMDAAGNSTLLSPHDSATNEWIYDSTYTPTGKRLRIRMEAMMKALNEHFGWDFVEEIA